MIGHQVPFLDLAFLALRELAEYTAQVPSDLPKQQLLAVLRREHDMVLALPCRVAQVILIWRHCDLLEGLAVAPRRSYDFATLLPKLWNCLYSLRHSRRLSWRANNPQQSWGFEGEPPEAVIKDSGTRDGTS